MLKFIVDFQKDIWNWWRIFYPEKSLYPIERISEKDRNIILSIKGLSLIEVKQRLREFIYKKYSTETRVDLFAIASDEVWAMVEKEFVLILETLTKKEFIFKNEIINVYITTAPLSPYNIAEKFLMLFPVKNIEQIKTSIAHELLHFHFHSHYEEGLINGGLSGEKFHFLKESLTFILNETEFKNIISVPDKGYDKHQEFRMTLKKIWDENRDFDLLIDRAVILLKSNT